VLVNCTSVLLGSLMLPKIVVPGGLVCRLNPTLLPVPDGVGSRMIVAPADDRRASRRDDKGDEKAA
jgi:hypothetical protein